MKISRRDLGLIMIIVGLMVAFLSYQFVYKPSMKELETVKEERKALEAQYEELKPVLDNQQQYATTIESISAKLSELVKRFPAYYLYEDGILYLREFEKRDDMTVFFDTFTIAESTLLDSYSGRVNKEEKMFALANATINATFTLGTLEDNESGYKDMKTMVSAIYADSKPKNIEAITLNFNRTNGLVNGVMQMNMYSFTDGTNAYEDPEIPNLSVGLKNGIFGEVVPPEEPKEETPVDPEEE